MLNPKHFIIGGIMSVLEGGEGLRYILLLLLTWMCKAVLHADLWFMFFNLLFCGQRLYFLLCCNFKKASQIWKIGNRKRHVLSDTKERMSWKGVDFLKLTKKGRRNVEFAWRWTENLYCLTAAIHCVWSVIVIGKLFVVFFFYNVLSYGVYLPFLDSTIPALWQIGVTPFLSGTFTSSKLHF